MKFVEFTVKFVDIDKIISIAQRPCFFFFLTQHMVKVCSSELKTDLLAMEIIYYEVSKVSFKPT